MALGFFDGFHLGHQAIVEAACRGAERPLVFTFHNHPASVVSPQGAPGLLTLADERLALLQAAGAEPVWCTFNRDFSQLSPDEFFVELLVRRLGARRLVSGANYRFGHRAAGTVDTLRKLAGPLGVEVVTVPGVQHDGSLISSTRIRASLAEGRPREATAMQGRPFSVEGVVQTGAQRGRTLQFPTANLALPEGKLRPAFGVYAVEVLLPGESQPRPGVANLGVRPTVSQQSPPWLETHLFDFEGDLYGQHLAVRLMEFLRPERRFSGLDELRGQISQDADAARALLQRPA